MSKRWIRPCPHPHPEPHQHGIHLRRSQSRPRRRYRRSRSPQRPARLHPAFPRNHRPPRARLADGTTLPPIAVIPAPREGLATIRRARPRSHPSLHHLNPLHFRNHPTPLCSRNQNSTLSLTRTTNSSGLVAIFRGPPSKNSHPSPSNTVFETQTFEPFSPSLCSPNTRVKTSIKQCCTGQKTLTGSTSPA